ncbi:MAG: phosphate acyltransferase PlsX [Eubacteriales bacterium]|nr:phosphate acyltransferase PlsX [Eubacteriales bacterium]
MIKIALDAMGGDNAPGEIIKGAVDAVNTESESFVYLVGKKEIIESELTKYKYNQAQIGIVDARDVIETGEPPVMAVRKKKDSSLVKGLTMVKNKEADAFVSAGSSGAILVGGQVIVGRLPGVERPPIGAIVPTDKGCCIIVDSGANVDARPNFLVQWAKMGSIYMESCVGIKNPRVAIVNVGLEEEKGNQLVKETYPLLKACNDINFIGSIEAREIPNSGADVIVCDAFVGNVILKLYEGLAGTLLKKIKGSLMSNLKTKIGALLIKGSLKETLKTMDSSEYGGAPLIGLNGLVVKTHGSSKAKEVKNSIIQCVTFAKQNINERIVESLKDTAPTDDKKANE